MAAKKMTRAEAAQFIAEAERLPPSEVDPVKLAEAITVLSEKREVDLEPFARATVPPMTQLLIAATRYLAEHRDEIGEAGAEAYAEAQEVVRTSTAALARIFATRPEKPLSLDFTRTKGQTGRDPLERALSLAQRIATAQGPTSPERFRQPISSTVPSEAAGSEPVGRAGMTPQSAAPTALPDAGRVGGPGPNAGGGAAAAAMGRAGGLTGGQTAVSATDALPASLRVRLLEAAAEAGIPDWQVDLVISQAQKQTVDSQEFGIDLSVTDIVEAQIEEWEDQARALGGAPIGVPDDFVASPQFDLDERTLSISGGRNVPEGVEPRYFDGDQFSPAGLSPENIARIQRRLVSAGLLEDDEYWEGFWDQITASQYGVALGYANQSGKDINQAIDHLIQTLPASVKEARQRRDAARVFQPDPFLKPDNATLAQEVKTMFRQRLGREPRSGELADLAGALGAAERARYDQEVAAARFSFDQQVGLEGGGVDGDVSMAELAARSTQAPPGTPTFTAVDPVARLHEIFEARYKPEMDRIVESADTRENMSNAFASLRSMSAMIDSD